MKDNKLVNSISLDYKESKVKKGLFTPQHKKFNCILTYLDKDDFMFTYQTSATPTFTYQTSVTLKKDDVLYSLISDYRAFRDNQELEEFIYCFGYEDFKEGIKAYKGCQDIYDKMCKMFTSEELEELEAIFEDY